MKRLIGIFIIIILLAILSVGEEIIVNTTTKTLQESSYSLEDLVKNNKAQLNTPQINTAFTDLDKFWDKQEHILCYIVNFEKIKPINESLHKLDGAIKENDYSVALENIKTLQNYSQNMHYVMGASITNFI